MKKPHPHPRSCTMFRDGERQRRRIIGKCVVAFPYMWFYVSAATFLSCLLLAHVALSLLARV